MEAQLIVLTSVVIFIAATVHGIAGFGYAQVAMGILPLFRQPGSASIIFTITAIVSNASVFWSVRDKFSWEEWGVPAIGLVGGLPVGIYIFKGLNDSFMRLLIGLLLIISVIIVLATEKSSRIEQWIKKNHLRPDWKIGFLAGFIAGILGGAVAIPGPSMILYGSAMMTLNIWDGEKMKAILTSFFGTLMAYRLMVLLVTADLTAPLVAEAVIVLPVLLIGAWVGIRIFNYMPQKIFSWIVLGGLTINAVILIVVAVQ